MRQLVGLAMVVGFIVLFLSIGNIAEATYWASSFVKILTRSATIIGMILLGIGGPILMLGGFNPENIEPQTPEGKTK